jgi:DNA-binding transcriptional ArsR family regulator
VIGLEKRNYSIEEMRTALLILRYLSKNPNAKDTIQGIAEWWILNERIDQTIDEIDKALDYLVSENLIRKRNYQGQNTYYEINNQKKDKISDVLDNMAQKIRSI